MADRPVELVPHDPSWAVLAGQHADQLKQALGDKLLAVHHIGSTAIRGIVAKPVVDLMPVIRSLISLDRQRDQVERLGYEWRGENGLAGRRYCALDDKTSGRRLVQLHCYEEGAEDVRRHLAFRDYLRANAGIAAEYVRLKQACRERYGESTARYSDCKDGWIKRVEAQALALGYGDQSSCRT